MKGSLDISDTSCTTTYSHKHVDICMRVALCLYAQKYGHIHIQPTKGEWVNGRIKLTMSIDLGLLIFYVLTPSAVMDFSKKIECSLR